MNVYPTKYESLATYNVALITIWLAHYYVTSAGVGASAEGFLVAGHTNLDACGAFERKWEVALVDGLSAGTHAEHATLLQFAVLRDGLTAQVVEEDGEVQ